MTYFEFQIIKERLPRRGRAVYIVPVVARGVGGLGFGVNIEGGTEKDIVRVMIGVFEEMIPLLLGSAVINSIQGITVLKRAISNVIYGVGNNNTLH